MRGGIQRYGALEIMHRRNFKRISLDNSSAVKMVLSFLYLSVNLALSSF